MKRFLAMVLAAVMLFTLVPMAGMTVFAESTTSITDEVATKIKSANTSSPSHDDAKINTLYAVGEANLTANDVVTVNGVDCYVLSVDTENNTAQLITKNIYDQRFNESGIGYDYATSDLMTYMNNFYLTTLASDSRIVDHTVTSYTKDSIAFDLSTFTTSTITQKVYALNAVEALAYASKFGSSSWEDYNAYRDSSYNNDCEGFWVSAGYFRSSDGFAFSVGYYGNVNESIINYSDYGARPAFTIDLTVSPSTATAYETDISFTAEDLALGKTVAQAKTSLAGFDTDKFEAISFNVLNSDWSMLQDGDTLNEGSYSVFVAIKVKDGVNIAFVDTNDNTKFPDEASPREPMAYKGNITLNNNQCIYSDLDTKFTNPGFEKNVDESYITLQGMFSITLSPSGATDDASGDDGSGALLLIAAATATGTAVYNAPAIQAKAVQYGIGEALAAKLVKAHDFIFGVAPAAAKIGEVRFVTLSAAAKAAKPGQTVTLLADNGETVVLKKAVEFTLDLNGHEFTGSITGKAA